MWAIGVLLFSALFCGSSLGVPHEISNGDVARVKTKFTNLDGDVLVMILDHLEFTNLLRVTEAMPWLSPHAAEIIRRRNYEFEINRAHKRDSRIIGRTRSESEEDLRIGDDGRIWLVKNQTILNVLKHFGSGIQRLIIENTWMTTDESDLNPSISQYASDSLKVLKIYNIKEESFKDLTAPFTKLEELRFQMRDLKGSVILPMPLNELFPQLRVIHISSSYHDIDFLDYEFSNLEDVVISFNDKGWHEMGRLKGFVEKNRNVRSVVMWRSPEGTMQLFNNHWPNLENITMEMNGIGHHPVHFEHLKLLHFRSMYNDKECLINKISAPALESLRIDYSPTFTNEWNEFVDKHSGLKYLIAEVGWREREPGLVELTTRMHNLVEMTVHSNNDFKIESIERIIQTHDKLLKFRLEPDYSQNNFVKTLEEKFGDEWNVESYTIKFTYTSKTGFLLTRKNAEPEN